MSAPRLERLATEAQLIVNQMPGDAQEQARQGLLQLISAAQALRILPPELVSKVWAILVHFVVAMQMPRTRASVYVRQIFAGAPSLFPQQWRIEILAELDKDEGAAS